MTPRTRKTVAVLCIALVVAGVLTVGPSTLGAAVLVALWLVLRAVVVTVIRREMSRSYERPVSLLALLESRAPPTLPVLA